MKQKRLCAALFLALALAMVISCANRQEKAEEYTSRGNAYAEKGDYDKAIADYTEAIRLDPDYAEAYNGRGIAYRNKGDIDKAIADYTEAIRLAPNDAAVYTNRGVAYRDKGDIDKAIADYNEAIRLKLMSGFAKKTDETAGNSVPAFVNEAYMNAPKDVLIGIGSYNIGGDPSKMSIAMTFAETRARADISRQLNTMVEFREGSVTTISRSDLRGARTVRMDVDTNGILWVVMEYRKAAAEEEINQADSL